MYSTPTSSNSSIPLHMPPNSNANENNFGGTSTHQPSTYEYQTSQRANSPSMAYGGSRSANPAPTNYMPQNMNDVSYNLQSAAQSTPPIQPQPPKNYYVDRNAQPMRQPMSSSYLSSTPDYVQPSYGPSPSNPPFPIDPTSRVMLEGAWQMVGSQAWSASQNYVDKNMGQVRSRWDYLKHFWNVSHGYVLSKCLLLLFPFRHKSFSRSVIRNETTGAVYSFKPPRYDVNSTDLYIPAMAYVTYVILVGVLMGMENRFTPEILTLTASTALFFLTVDVLFLRLGIYLLDVQTDPPIQITDLIAYSGYQFVHIIVVQAASSVKLWYVKYSVLLYCCGALGWYSLRSLRHCIVPTSDPIANANIDRKKRVYFLFIFVILQSLGIWWMVK